ncbi:MAG: DUF2116 family Zn-ribbon domain-containing protein [Candidatus Omnitrophica bacterium]|nr:DUF2116 family Zn-ribbon domain-containing protein [Candidatus Omnitrophota bacterium]
MPEADFDFKDVNQEPEILDYDNLLPCPHCNKPIPSNSTMCLYCSGEVYFNKRKKPLWIVLTAVILLLLLIIFFIF